MLTLKEELKSLQHMDNTTCTFVATDQGSK